MTTKEKKLLDKIAKNIGHVLVENYKTKKIDINFTISGRFYNIPNQKIGNEWHCEISMNQSNNPTI